jgi:hypothetical protein
VARSLFYISPVRVLRLELPRALVSLSFDGITAHDQQVFLKRFDFQFQRGGG